MSTVTALLATVWLTHLMLQTDASFGAGALDILNLDFALNRYQRSAEVNDAVPSGSEAAGKDGTNNGCDVKNKGEECEKKKDKSGESGGGGGCKPSNCVCICQCNCDAQTFGPADTSDTSSISQCTSSALKDAHVKQCPAEQCNCGPCNCPTTTTTTLPTTTTTTTPAPTTTTAAPVVVPVVVVPDTTLAPTEAPTTTTTVPTTTTTIPCPPAQWTNVNGHYFYKSGQTLTFAAGESFCQTCGAHLPYMHDQATWDGLLGYWANAGTFWLGLNDLPPQPYGTRIYTDGSAFDFNSLIDNDHKPGLGTEMGYCVRALNTMSYTWYDDGCDAAYAIICERDTPPP